MSNASIYSGQNTLIPVVNSFGNVFEEWQIATAGQVIFILASFQYTPGTNTLLVFKNGLFQRPGFDYTETNSTRIAFTTPTALNDRIAFFAWATLGTAIPNGGGLPAGGTTGQVPAKLSANDYDVGWINLSALASLLDAPVSAVASINTVNLIPLATVTRNISISGTTTIAGFQVTSGQLFSVKVTGNFTITNSAAILCPNGQDIKARSGDSFFLRAEADNVVSIIGYSKATAATQVLQGQCRLVKSGANLLLSRYNGFTVPINGTNETIPAGGITLAPTALTPGQLYFIYAWMNAGVMTLEASITGHSTDAVTGVEIKTGDVTRSLVGMAQITTGPAWIDTDAARYVVSWYNRRAIRAQVSLGANVSTALAGPVEIEPTFRINVLAWAADIIEMSLSGTISCTSVATVSTLMNLSGIVTGNNDGGQQGTIGTANYYLPLALTPPPVIAPVDGNLQMRMYGGTNAGSGVWLGSATVGNRTNMSVVVQG